MTGELEAEQDKRSETVRRVQRAGSWKTEILNHPLLRNTCVGKCLVELKEIRSESSQEVGLH
jgi:hypothetical protein